jgi:undecaprenyl-diphosphatase
MLMQIDTALFHFINKTLANPFFDLIMPAISWLGTGDAVFAAALIIIIVGKKEQKRYGVILLAGLTLTYYSVDFLKDLIGRPRPYMMLTDVHLLEKATKSLSMPSGHATTAFMAATVLPGLTGRRAVWFSIAALVGLSRVCVGAHYVSDVLAGALLGALIGYGLMKFARYTHIS